MSDVHLTDVQFSNLTMLLTIRDCLHRDRIRTCCQFGLDAEQANCIQDLRTHQIMAIVSHVGQVCLFPPRMDLISLLALPLPVARTLAVVWPPRVTQ